MHRQFTDAGSSRASLNSKEERDRHKRASDICSSMLSDSMRDSRVQRYFGIQSILKLCGVLECNSLNRHEEFLMGDVQAEPELRGRGPIDEGMPVLE